VLHVLYIYYHCRLNVIYVSESLSVIRMCSMQLMYLSITILLLFVCSSDTFKMVSDDSSGIRFHVLHHYETNVKAAGDVNNAARARRLAQEAVTLSTSLPLSAGSSVFVRCDEERLDVMKVHFLADLLNVFSQIFLLTQTL